MSPDAAFWATEKPMTDALYTLVDLKALRVEGKDAGVSFRRSESV
jgi:hypothetical protein